MTSSKFLIQISADFTYLGLASILQTNKMLFAELGIHYFLPYSLIAIPLLQCTISLSLLRYFSEFCNTLFAIRYFL
jgi:hypothetical protein